MDALHAAVRRLEGEPSMERPLRVRLQPPPVDTSTLRPSVAAGMAGDDDLDASIEDLATLGFAVLAHVHDADCLRLLASDPRLFSLELYYAAWGYCTASQVRCEPECARHRSGT